MLSVIAYPFKSHITRSRCTNFIFTTFNCDVQGVKKCFVVTLISELYIPRSMKKRKMSKNFRKNVLDRLF